MENENGSEYAIYCSRCGAKMSSNSRYCMKCGNLNYDHEANKNMKPFMPEEKTKKAGKFFQHRTVTQKVDNSDIHKVLSQKIGNRTVCFYLNVLLLIVGIALGFVITTNLSFDLNEIMTSYFPLTAIGISLFFLYLYSFELLFMRCERAWWLGFIPIYRWFVLSDVVFQKSWLGFLLLIPGVNIIYCMVLFYKLGESFKYNGLWICLFLPITIPLLAFGSHVYNNSIYVTSNDDREVEKEYGRRKWFLILVVFFIILGVGLIVLAGVSSEKNKGVTFNGLYFMYASKTVVSKIDQAIADDKVACKYDIFSKDSGIYYFVFDDLGDSVSLFLYDLREPIKGYVKVDNTSGESVYYISLSDGTNGFSEMPVEEVTGSTVTSFNRVKINASRDMNTCRMLN